MKKTGRLPAAVINILLIVGLVALWIAFAPSNIGGRVSYVMVNGISMEPGFHLGDLTVIHRSPEYQVGDIVTYHDSHMQAFVIHRIIGVEQDGYILKGDNNSWIDAYRPTKEEIVGKLWIHIPKLGRLFTWLRIPLNLALTIGLLGGVLMIGMIKTERQPNRNYSSQDSGGLLEGGLYLLGFFALVFLGIGVFAFIRPLTRPADKIQYQQESHFSYSATGTPVIYDTDTVRSGEPVFPRLTCFLNVSFTYNIIGDQLKTISGTHQMIARVMDEQSGWQRTIPLSQPTAFSGNTFSTASTVDLCQIITLVNILKQETGLRANTYTLEVIPQVATNAAIDANQVSASFEPRLVFRFDEVHFSLTSPKGQDDPLNFSQKGSVQNSNLEANTLSILGWEPEILTIRLIALIGLALSASGLVILGLRVFTTARQGQDALIRLRYGALLVNVYERDIEPAASLIDVTTIDELAKLAERHNTVILHMAINFLHYYMVQCNGATYRFVFSARKRNTPVIEPPRREMMEYAFNVRQTKLVGTKLVEDDPFEQALDMNVFTRTEVEETVVLRRIKL